MSNDNFLLNNQLVNQETRKTLCDIICGMSKNISDTSVWFSAAAQSSAHRPLHLDLDEGMCSSSVTRSNETWRMRRRGRSLKFLIVFCKVLFSVLVQQQMKLQSCWRYSSKLHAHHVNPKYSNVPGCYGPLTNLKIILRYTS